MDEMLNRSDIRSDPATGAVKDGVPLRLVLRVGAMAGSSCSALAGAMVDIWHCDALGVYSDTRDPAQNTLGQKFLRGYQVTDANGAVQFQTIYPGWYQGRTVHIHFKIRTAGAGQQGREFTSQLYFDDRLSDQVFRQQPYASKGQNPVRNNADGIFRSGGDRLLLQPTPDGQGFAATFDVGLQLS